MPCDSGDCGSGLSAEQMEGKQAQGCMENGACHPSTVLQVVATVWKDKNMIPYPHLYPTSCCYLPAQLHLGEAQGWFPKCVWSGLGVRFKAGDCIVNYMVHRAWPAAGACLLHACKHIHTHGHHCHQPSPQPPQMGPWFPQNLQRTWQALLFPELLAELHIRITHANENLLRSLRENSQAPFH